jgi:hypothetical protein
MYNNKNIFCGISYMRIVEILERYIHKDEIRKIQKQRISSILKTIPKTKEHNKKVSDSIKKAWKDGKFNTKEYIKAIERGYKKRPSIKGKNNPMYGKPSPRGAGFGKGGIRKDIGHYVRSTWEANVCRIFQYMKRDYKFESKRFKIVIDNNDYTYCPDFYFPTKDFYYEVKGHAKSSNNWVCSCDTCNKNKKKIAKVRKEYNIKIIIIGHEEYKRFKRKFKLLIPNWEN